MGVTVTINQPGDGETFPKAGDTLSSESCTIRDCSQLDFAAAFPSPFFSHDVSAIQTKCTDRFFLPLRVFFPLCATQEAVVGGAPHHCVLDALRMLRTCHPHRVILYIVC